MRHLALSVSLAACGLLAACAEQGTDPQLTDGTISPADDPTVGTDPETIGAPTSPDLAEGSPIWFEPSRIDGCERGVSGVIHWDASSFPGVQVVKVALPAKDGTESVFAVSAVTGEKETGPWLGVGSEVILRDNATDEELARAEMPGLPCED